jgi:hypothetical protein
METLDFAIQPCQSKFTLWKAETNKIFGEFVSFFPNWFEPPIDLDQI